MLNFSMSDFERIVSLMKVRNVEEFVLGEPSVNIRISFRDEESCLSDKKEEELSINEGLPPVITVKSDFIGRFIPSTPLSSGSLVKRGELLGYVDSIGIEHYIKTPSSGKLIFIENGGSVVQYGTVIAEIESEGIG